ncbi:GEVED domain-containing protein [Adhaeribacter soli]|uniref:PKD domain-containing protein n=1 Tax=Adhaeribacter soli TaxID=2607655 RepID=A0A5N1J6T4_9BACT|nr:GEVED domain-containing protein [Adhaeribacter soli]KAA9340907.1 PKD domain-containing protein [Adhaeribacter soli]
MKIKLPIPPFFTSLLLLVLAFLCTGTSLAQCPVASACIPGNLPAGNIIFGMGILNVNINNGAINNNSPANTTVASYYDYSCSIGASLSVGVGYPISIRTNNNVNENVRVWLDLDNNGTINPTTELVFSSNNAQVHTGTFSIPASAVTGLPLRMRISADNFSSPLPTPCSSPQYSQVEDYRITVLANGQAPVARFSASDSLTCSGTVRFTDQSQNGPTSWNWNFDDGNTSTQQNPVHTYASPGVYNVTLLVSNSNGNSTKVRPVIYHTNVPVAATCTPGTSNYCCSYGITNVNFGNGLLVNSSQNGVAGYEDFTCSKFANVIVGLSYPVSITTGANPHDTRIYIDFNNDGSFSSAGEMVFQALNRTNPAGTITIPRTATLNTRLRMRIISDNSGSSFTSCSGIQSGQAEDYTIVILPNTQPPVANFKVSNQTSCSGTELFEDLSVNDPTSWQWHFGDPGSGTANTSTLQNPTHVFSTPGFYTITLIATNAFGSDTITKVNFVNYSPASAFCTTVIMPVTGTAPVATGCSGSVYDPGGPTGQYPNAANSTVTIAPSGAALVRLNFTSFDLEPYADELYIYDGSSTSSPLIGVYSGNTLPKGGTITSTGSAITLRFMSDNFSRMAGFAANWTCIMPMIPVADFKANTDSICIAPVRFQDMSVNLPTSWQWDFGDPASGAANTSTLRNPSHRYSNQVPGAYTVTLISCNSMGCDTLVKTNYINVAVPCLTYCASQNNSNTDNYISNVTFGTLNHSSSADTRGYGNYTTQNSNIILGSTNTISVQLGKTVYSGFVTVWIDLDKDGVFQTSEKLFHGYTPNISTSVPLLATGSITIPNSVQAGPTRMRVMLSGDYQQNNPCASNLNFGETEDYQVTFLPNATPMIGGFSADLNTVCTGTVQFKDASINGATSWLWDFGDPASGAANTSTLQNPTHTYPLLASASYNVSLIVCRGAQCDTISKPDFVTIPIPCQTYCRPAITQSPNDWMSNVSVGTLNNSTASEPNGYGNYTNLRTNLVLGSASNPVTITKGGNGSSSTVRIWIDFNKNGTFDLNELVFDKYLTYTYPNPAYSATGTVAVPSSAFTGFTRMRVILTYSSSFISNCPGSYSYAEVEDYTVNILPNTLPPTADFRPDLANNCSGAVQFTDASLNGPTSWQWDFGDPASGANNTSTLQHPVHQYPTGTAGNYTVTLVACKAGQCDTITKPNLIKLTAPCQTYCAVTNAGGNNHFRWISKVNVGTINNATIGEPNGYGNYTYLATDLMLGVPHPITVNLVNSTVYMYVYAWIDLNQDGTFSANELVFKKQTTTVGYRLEEAVGNILLPGNALPGLTRMRVVMYPISSLNSPCQINTADSEVEDYLVNILPNPNPIVAGFSANMNTVCQGPVQFFDTSLNGPTSWLWNFGDPASGAANTSTLQNPTHTYPITAAGSYDVTLIACKGALCDTLVYTKSINISKPCLSYCINRYTSNNNQWIGNVSIGSINHSSGAEALAYGNYTYLNTSGHASMTGIPVSVTLGKSSGPAKNIMILIDFNRDGTFQSTEQAFNTQAVLTNGQLVASGSLVIPPTALEGPTRMRVMIPIHPTSTDPCPNSYSEIEVEDYTFIILQNPAPPVSDFGANGQITCNGAISFTDRSLNFPFAWSWNFGDPNSGTADTSTLQHPTHTFTSPGLYTITLITTNAFGTDTIIKTNYINFDPANIACQTIFMPVSGTIPARTACTGMLYDDGGQFQNYSDNVNGVAIIAPPNAATVSLTFTRFQVESTIDVLRIFDGADTLAPLLGTYWNSGTWGGTLPNNGFPITSTGKAMTIHFKSNNYYNYSGFQAYWTCNTPTPVGIKEANTDALFEVYPNPSSGLVNLKLKQNRADFKVEISNMLGQVLLSEPLKPSGSKTQQLDLRRFSKGVYFIRIHNEQTSGIRKIVLD